MDHRGALGLVLNEYADARTEPLRKHPLAARVTGEVEDTVRQIVGPDWLVEASVGKGNWAETPWLCVFHPSVTTTAQRGFYVVYLFRGDGQAVYLSLNQATTEVKEQVGGRKYLRVLEQRASVDSALLTPHGVDDLLHGPIELTGSGGLTRGYEAGNIVAVQYDVEALPTNEILGADLSRLLGHYRDLIEAREAVDESTGEDLPPGVSPGVEAQRFRWHRRAERNPRLARDAKKFHGFTCQVCKFNFENRYGTRGEGYIEAHHIVPFADLAARPDEVTLDPKTDFAVVCANCHRMLHRGDPAISPAQLEQVLRYGVAITGVDTRSWFSRAGISRAVDDDTQHAVAELLVGVIETDAERAELRSYLPSSPPGVLALMVPRTKIYVIARDIKRLRLTVFAGLLAGLLSGAPAASIALPMAASIWASCGRLTDDELEMLRKLERLADNGSVYDTWMPDKTVLDSWPANERAKARTILRAMQRDGVLEESSGSWRAVL